MSRTTQAIILAGGSGSRLWPLSRQQLPKQFLKLSGDESLLRATVTRLAPLIEPSDVWVVTGDKHANGEAFEDLLPYNTILEPAGRNTAPAIALAAALLLDKREDPIMVVLPADHIIINQEQFRGHLQEAIVAAEAGHLVTFGIKPTRPDTGFGYIEAVDRLDESALHVRRFAEKPDAETAQQFLDSGNFFWNSGMFVWKASTILAEIATHLPAVHALALGMRAAWQGGEDWKEVIQRDFGRMPDISIDYGVLEKSDKVVLIPCDIGWSDVGSWDALYDLSPKDGSGNVHQGNTLAIDCHNTLIRADGRLVAAVGLSDLCLIDTPDALLVIRRGESQRVREVVDELKKRNSSEYSVHLTVKRPWGSYTVLEEQESGYKIKRIMVKPGAALSLQSHQHRSEHWVVVNGTATITNNDQTFVVTKNESTYIPIGMKHRLENRGKLDLHLIEVQVGDYLGEDDIERYEDRYGRKAG